MKSFTDIPQSKKLAEILPIKSADMCYRIVAYNPNDAHVYQPYCFVGTLESDIPAWSLAALLQVLPIGIYDEFDNCDYELEIDMIDKMPRYIRLGDIYHSQFPYDFEKDTLIDNIVESIIWLNDNNYFEL